MTPITAWQQELDVVVIGAGAAGISAGRRLQKAGASFVLVEAGTRAGGRGHTEVHDGFPLDLGCGWLHSADRNPWSDVATATGVTIDRTRPPWEKQSCDHGLTAAEQADFGKAFGAFDERVEAAHFPPDVAAAAFLEPGCRWNVLLDAVSTYFNGVTFGGMSAEDYRNYDDTEVNWRLPTGYGTLIVGHGAPLPIALNTPVREIDHTGARLRIVTDHGILSARAAIVTVSSAVIAREILRFSPLLPDKIDSAVHLPLGTVDKIFLRCDQPGMFPQEGHLFGSTTRVDTMSYHLRPFGRPLIEGFVAGALAKDLSRDSHPLSSAMFAIEELAALIGGDLRKHLHPVTASAWERETFIGGAYSHAEVGCAAERIKLAAPVDNRIFFAGEACSLHSYSTAHGAFITGKSAAEQALAALGGLEQTETATVRTFTRAAARRAGKRKSLMAKYSESTGKDVKNAMERRKTGALKSGKGGKGGTVKSRKQAIAIGLSEARAKGEKVPKRKSAKKPGRKGAKKKAAKKSSRKSS